MDTQPKYKVFLIDDDTFLLNMYSLKFSKSGFEVNTAQTTHEALQKIKQGYEPDIMLIDIIMPGMDGLEMLSEIRKENLAPKATVIMLTNQSDTTDIEKAKGLDVDGYIVKATTIPSEVISDVVEIHKKHTQS
ncbi:response regulator [Candidatus Parcubacteria bacterium]|nr:response regulator [Candidatus Parcubacteria bacterium]